MLKKISFLIVLVLAINNSLFGQIRKDSLIYAEANSAYEEGDLDYSFALCDTLILKYPNNLRLVANAYNLKGMIYVRLDQAENGLIAFKKRLGIERKLKSKDGEAKTLGNLAIVLYELDELDSAIVYNLKCIKVLESNDERIDMSTAYNSQGRYLTDKKVFKEAEKYLIKAENDAKKYGNNRILSFTYSSMCNLYTKSGNFDKGKHYCNLAEEKSKEIGDIYSLINVYSEKTELFKNSDNYELAFKYKKLHYNLRDSIYSLETTKNIQELEKKYESEKKNNKIISQNNSLLKTKALLERKENQNLILIYSVLFVILLVLVVFFGLKYKLSVTKLILKNRILKDEKLKELMRLKELKIKEFSLLNTESNLFIESIEKKIKIILKTASRENKYVLSELKGLVTSYKSIGKGASLLTSEIDEYSKDFNFNLLNKHQDLTGTELKLAVYVRLNMSAKEIANLLTVESRTVNVYKYRLKIKLLGDTKNVDLLEYLETF